MPYSEYHHPKPSRCPSAKCGVTTTGGEQFEIATIDPKGGVPMYVLQCSHCGGVVCVLPREAALVKS